MEERVGVMDIGANSIRLNMYEIKDGRLRELISKKNIAGLASYREGGRLSDKGVQKLINTVKSLLRIYNLTGGKVLYAFATASLRDISNQEEVLSIAEENTGLKIEIIPQELEAKLGLEGVLSGHPEKKGLAIDIGGGSAEITYFNEDNLKIFSLKDGSLSLYRNFVSGILPEKNEIKMIKEHIKEQLSQIPHPEDTDKVIGIGGSIRAAGNVIFELGYSASNIDFTKDNLNQLYSGLKNHDELTIKTVLQVVPERIHTITPGVIVLRTIASVFGIENITVSSAGIREGFLVHALGRDKDEQ